MNTICWWDMRRDKSLENKLIHILTYKRHMIASVKKATDESLELGHIYFLDTGARTYGNYSIPRAKLAIWKPSKEEIDKWVESYNWFHQGSFKNDGKENVSKIIRNTK